MSQYRGRRRSFRNTILLMLVLVLGLAVALVWSNTVLQTEEFTFVSSRLPAAFNGYRVVVLSDFHSAVFGEENRDLLQRVEDAKPNLIAVMATWRINSGGTIRFGQSSWPQRWCRSRRSAM